MFDLDAELRRWRERQEHTSSLSPRELDELEDHLRARVDLLLETDATLAPQQAFKTARKELGQSAALSSEFAKSGSPRWRKLLVAGWAMYAVSFFLPAAHNFRWGTGSGQDFLWGWQAPIGALLAAGDGAFWLSLLRVLSGLSNALVLATFLKLKGSPASGIHLARAKPHGSNAAQPPLGRATDRSRHRLLGLDSVICLHRLGSVDART